MTIQTDLTINPAALARTQPELRSSHARPVAVQAPGETFSAAMQAAKGAAAPAGAGAEMTIRPLVKHEAREVAPLEQFEGFVLRSFIESMLPSEDSDFYGKGTAGSIWRSKMAEEIGNEIAKGGGIGIADTIAGKNGGHAAERARMEAADGVARLRAQDGAADAALFGAKKVGR